MKMLKFDYHIFEPDLMNINITKKYGHFDLKRDNLMIFFNIVIHFEDRNNEFGIEFMNKTINLCKMLGNRRYEPVMGFIYQASQENAQSSLPKKCPIKKVNKTHSLSYRSFFTNFTFFL